jgi:hypothetical protein
MAAGSPGFGLARDDGYAPGTGRQYKSSDIVPVWQCQSGCPVAELDKQSTETGMHSAGSFLPSTPHPSPHKTPGWGNIGMGPLARVGDTGGASRFFKQIQEI